MSHDYAGCAVETCTPCAAYEMGWTLGKVKAFAEVSQWQPGAHAADCGCGPCQAVASIVAALIHDGIRERLDRRGVAPDVDRESRLLTGRSEAAVGRRQRTHESVVESPSGIPPLAAPGVTGRSRPPWGDDKGPVSRGVSKRDSAAGRTRAANGTAERHQPYPHMGKTIHHVSPAIRTGGI